MLILVDAKSLSNNTFSIHGHVPFIKFNDSQLATIMKITLNVADPKLSGFAVVNHWLSYNMLLSTIVVKQMLC